MDYRVAPGLYAVGRPTPASPVFVSANFKLSFDLLRASLNGRDGWILVLETYGINVWCAAGKGTFGTAELINRIAATGLEAVVEHRRLIVPQLGAVGVSAHQVRKASGFNVRYGPVRAADIGEYLDGGMKATASMRRVSFGAWERLILTPIELVNTAPIIFAIALGLLLLSGVYAWGYDAARLVEAGITSVVMIALAWISGAVLAPLLLPWLPGRAFATKGALAGLVLAGAALYVVNTGGRVGMFDALAWAVLIPAISSFLMMNFTGASTFTSISGVQREMLYAVPLQLSCAVIGLGFWIAGRFI